MRKVCEYREHAEECLALARHVADRHKATSGYRGCLDHARRRPGGPTRQAGKATTRASYLELWPLDA